MSGHWAPKPFNSAFSWRFEPAVIHAFESEPCAPRLAIASENFPGHKKTSPITAPRPLRISIRSPAAHTL